MKCHCLGAFALVLSFVYFIAAGVWISVKNYIVGRFVCSRMNMREAVQDL